MRCHDERCQENDHYEYEDDHDDDDDEDEDDLYALVVIPILGIIGGFLTFLIRRYKNVILLRLFNRLLDCIDGDERAVSMETDTDTTSVESTLMKERLRENQNLDISSASSSFLSDNIWKNRMGTDAEKVFRHIMEESKDDSQHSSTTIVEMRDMAIQISLPSDSEDEVELQDLSVRCDQDSSKSDDLSEILETSFVETRSGQKYLKKFVRKK